MPQNRSTEASARRKRRAPAPEPWEGARRRPAERPRHESAQPDPREESDPAQTSGAIAAESWGEVIEVCPDESVDGDFNGAPELESLDRTERWQGVDALEGMAGRDAELPSESSAPEEVLAEVVAARRSVLVERLDDAREVGLGPVFEAAIAVTAPVAGNTPIVVDDEVLRDQLAAIDAALEELEARSA